MTTFTCSSRGATGLAFWPSVDSGAVRTAAANATAKTLLCKFFRMKFSFIDGRRNYQASVFERLPKVVLDRKLDPHIVGIKSVQEVFSFSPLKLASHHHVLHRRVQQIGD